MNTRKKFLLNVFGEVVPGRKLVYLLRVLKSASQEAASLLAYSTENGRSMTAEATTTTTKDGVMRAAGQPTVEITGTALLQKGDPMLGKLQAAMEAGDLVEVWEANLDEPVNGQTNKFSGRYHQGYFTNLSTTSNAEGNVEIQWTVAVNGAGVTGSVTVTAEQQEEASYVFADTTRQS